MELTALEWWSLCAALAERESSLAERERQGERVGKDRAALARAETKVRDALVTDRSWRFR